MQRFWQILRNVCFRTSLLGGCLLLQAIPAWAKEADKGGGGPGTSAWVFMYILIILCIALGMLVVCKSSGRRERAKPEAYGEGKETAAETEKKK